MAKYRITSIPQGLDQFRKGGVKRDRKTGYWKAKKRNNNSIINYTPPSDDEVQDFVPKGYSFDFGPSSTRSNSDGTDLGAARSLRLKRQLAGNQRPLTPPEEAFQFNAGYDVTADQAGDPLAFVCPDGQIDYMGKCISEEAYRILAQEELDRFTHAYDVKHTQRLQKTLDELNENRMNTWLFEREQDKKKFDEDTIKYYEDFNKSKKSDKIKPLTSVLTKTLSDQLPVTDENGEPVIDPKTGQPLTQTREELLKQQFLVIKNDDGKADLYPLDVVGQRIVKNGFQAEQFKNIWGIDDKQVKEQLGPFLKAAKDNYEGEVSQYIVKNALEKGKSAEEVIEGLSTRVGYQSNLKKTFQKKTQKQIDDAYEEVKKSILDSYDLIGQGDPNEPTPFTDDMFASGEDVQTAWEKKYHPDPFDPYYANKQKYIDEQSNTFNTLTNNKWNRTNTSVSENPEFPLPKTSTISDRYADMDSYYEQEAKRNYDINLQPDFKSKEFSDALGNYVNRMSSYGTKDVLKDAFKSLESDPNLKSKFTNAILTGQGASAFDELLSLKTKDDKGKELSYKDIIQDKSNKTLQAAASHFGQNFMRETPFSEIRPEITTGQKILDVLGNLSKSVEYFMDDRKQMWEPGDTKTFTEKRYLQKEKGLDYGIDESFGPMSVIQTALSPIESLNPFKIGTQLAEYYNDNNLTKGLINQAFDIGTGRMLPQSLNLLGQGKALQALGKYYSSPLINYGMVANAVRPGGTFSQAKDFYDQGNIEDALKTAGIGALELGPLTSGLYRGAKSLLTTGEIPIPGSYGLQYSLPSGKSISLTPRNANNAFQKSAETIGQVDPKFKKAAEEYFSSPIGKAEFRDLSRRYHPDKVSTSLADEQKLANNVMQKLTNLSAGDNVLGTQFTFTPSGLVSTQGTKSLLDLGRAGQLKLTGLQQPASLEYELLKSVGPDAFNLVKQTQPVIKGYLPSGLPSGLNYKKGGALPKAETGLTVAVKSLTAPVKSNTVNILKSGLTGLTARRNAVQSLRNLGYIGKEFTGSDAYRAALSEDKMNALMQKAIDFDRTGYRQVSGLYNPQGISKDTGFPYDMTELAVGAPRPEALNMDIFNVDKTNPISLGEYQATTIPMQAYGRRAGIGSFGGKFGSIYLASLPEKMNPDYGAYQFEVKLPTDYSTGNWEDWYNRYVLNKQAIQQKVGNFSVVNRDDMLPGNIYFDMGAAQGVGRDKFGDSGIAVGSGLNTRIWAAQKGDKIGNINPNFQFTDLLNMNAKDYNAMEDLKAKLIKGYNTGWRGEYKKGGALPKKRIGGLTRFTGLGKSLPPAVLEGFNVAPNAMKILSGLANTVKSAPKIDPTILNQLGNIKPESFTPIRYEGESYIPMNQEWASVSPDDYNIINPETNAPMLDPDWKNLGKEDANISLNEYISGLPAYGSETFKGVGDFRFQDFSDGWAARNAMMNMADNPQDLIGKSDFFTEAELTKMVNQQSDWQKARNEYEEMYPFDLGNQLAISSGDVLEFDKLFSDLYPNVGMPNFRSKFILPQHEALLQKGMPWQFSLQNRGKLDPVQLRDINKNENVLNTWREDLNTPFKGSDAWREISNQRGYKNKKGGVVTTLSKKEIDKYVKDGYIVEEV